MTTASDSDEGVRGTATVRNKPDAERYELYVRGTELAGTLSYTADDGVVSLVHTEVRPQWAGNGLASIVVRAALDDLRGRGLSVRPQCEYVAGYIDKHPQYRDLVAH